MRKKQPKPGDKVRLDGFALVGWDDWRMIDGSDLPNPVDAIYGRRDDEKSARLRAMGNEKGQWYHLVRLPFPVTKHLFGFGDLPPTDTISVITKRIERVLSDEELKSEEERDGAT